VRRLATLVLPLLALATAPGLASAASRASPVVSVQTIPAVSGLTLTYEHRHYVTDSAGRVTFPREPGTAGIDVRPRIHVYQRQLDAHTKVRFYRWFTVGSQFYAALDVYRPVRWRFVDGSGAPVPVRRVERIVLRSSSGEVRVFRTTGLGRPHWLFSQRATSIRGHVKLKNIDYRLERVTVLGSDVVNAGAQKFSPQHDRTVRFRLAFYTLTVRGEDMLFGSSVGTHARLELPNGAVRRLTFVHGVAVVRSLPRGSYKITLGDGVYQIPQPLLLSRSQVAVVPVVTLLDASVVGGGLFALALGLLLVGRPHLARRASARVAARGRAPSPRTEGS
jgi:hypothetical protein